MSTLQVSLDGHRLLLPTGNDPDGENTPFSSWDDAKPTLVRFCTAALRGRRPGPKGVDVAVALVHRPDNDYNPNAISVAMPAAQGGSVTDRHMGYLYDHYLRRLGMGLLPDLVELLEQVTSAPIEILCRGKVWDTAWLALDLPPAEVLRAAVLEFGGTQVAGGGRLEGTWNPKTDRVSDASPSGGGSDLARRHTREVTATRDALAWVESFVEPAGAVRQVDVFAYEATPGRDRTLYLSDTVGERGLGVLTTDVRYGGSAGP